MLVSLMFTAGRQKRRRKAKSVKEGERKSFHDRPVETPEGENAKDREPSRSLFSAVSVRSQCDYLNLNAWKYILKSEASPSGLCY